ncbi:MAG: hypothetical protein HOV87_03320 [Catenulispora sp.]|nr:hypothetical protein [Catenulispora sp.]
MLPDTALPLDPAAPAAILPQGAERESVVAFLRAGSPILSTTAKAPDVFDEGTGDVVPMSLRSDGEWVWSDAHAYYLGRYGVVTDAAFLEHIRRRDFRCAVLDDAACATVLESFYAAGDEEDPT